MAFSSAWSVCADEPPDDCRLDRQPVAEFMTGSKSAAFGTEIRCLGNRRMTVFAGIGDPVSDRVVRYRGVRR